MMRLRGVVFSAIVGMIWAMSFANADYFGLAAPWNWAVLILGSVLIGIVAPQYRTGN